MRLALALAVCALAGCATQPEPLQPPDAGIARLAQCIGHAEFTLLSEPLRSPAQLKASANIGKWTPMLEQKSPSKAVAEQYHTWGSNSVAPYAPGGQAMNAPGARAGALAQCETEFGMGGANG